MTALGIADFLSLLLLLVAVAAVAFLYSSVGHGGATGYLAVMSLVGVAPALARPGALWINCVVAAMAFWRFSRAGHFDLRIFLSLALASIPLAWLGSQVHLDNRAGAIVLGLALAVAGGLLGWAPRRDDLVQPERTRGPALPVALLVGGALGFLAGLTGIGGGVFLTPLLIFCRWTPAKTAAGISALFIVVNSASGLVGLGDGALVLAPVDLLVLAVALVAAFIGSRLGAQRWTTTTFRRALAVVLWIAAAKLLLTGR